MGFREDLNICSNPTFFFSFLLFSLLDVVILFLNHLPYPSYEHYLSPGDTWKAQPELKGNTNHGLHLYTELTCVPLLNPEC